jgi:hypothetical protein
MIDEVAWQLVPREMPQGVPPWVPIALRSTVFEDERERLAYAWAQRLLFQVSDGPAITTAIIGAVATDRPLIADISAGFIPFGSSAAALIPGTRDHSIAQFTINDADIPVREARHHRYTFGVVIGIDDGARPTNFREDFSQLVRLDGSFPVVCERRVLREDAPPNPGGAATSSCYARPLPTKRYYSGVAWTDGILIARHVLNSIGTSPGTIVPMVAGSAAIADIDSATTIDAAILDIAPGTVPAVANSLRISTLTPIGSKVSVRGASNQFNADVLRVMDDPRYFGNMAAHRVFLDAFGASGDSGALVTSNANGEVVGIYIGAHPQQPIEGIAQWMRQVTEYFEIELLD